VTQPTVKNGNKAVIVIGALITLLMAIDAGYVRPAFLLEAAKDIQVHVDRAMVEHARAPHQMSVTRQEFEMFRERLTKVEEQVIQRLTRMEAKIDAIK
jgi:hypothetical protein